MCHKGLVTNYVHNGRGGHMKFYPYEKVGEWKSFSHAEVEGAQEVFGVVFTQ